MTNTSENNLAYLRDSRIRTGCYYFYGPLREDNLPRPIVLRPTPVKKPVTLLEQRGILIRTIWSDDMYCLYKVYRYMGRAM